MGPPLAGPHLFYNDYEKDWGTADNKNLYVIIFVDFRK